MFDSVIHRWLRVPYRLHVHAERKPAKYSRTVVFLHGIGNSGAAWEDVISKLPADIRVISLDLLGFGHSPRPAWAVYSVRTQARSVITTLVGLKLSGRITLVGHSLGSLVAVEVAKRYPLAVRSLVLCSPPFYDERTDKNRLLRTAFRHAERHPERFVRLAAMAMKYNLINKSFQVTADNVTPYIATLGASILTQNSLEDAKRLKKPMILLFGALDPFVKKRHLRAIIAVNRQAKLRTIIAGHEVRGPYIEAAVRAIVESTR